MAALNVPAPTRWMFLLNPRAGGRTKHRIQQYILAHWAGKSVLFAETDAIEGASAAVAQGLQQGVNGFVAVGGDGTVQALAKCVRDTNTVLGIIPAGSGNGLAGWLGLRKDLGQNLDVLLHGTPIQMDTGSVNGQVFVNLAGVGFDAMVAHATKRSRIRGFLPYLLASFRLAFGNIFWNGQVVWPGGREQGSFLTVIVANGAVFGYGFRLIPYARVNDGSFTLLLIRKVARWRYLISLPLLLMGRKRIFPWMQVIECEDVTITPNRATPLHADGEALPVRQSYHFRMHPASLNVLVPADCPALEALPDQV